MKKILIPILLFFAFSSVAQDTTRTSTIYIPIKAYKALGFELTKIDSLNFLYKRGDTLVKMPKGFKTSPLVKGIEVPFEPRDSSFLEKYKDVVYATDRKNTRQTPTLKIWLDDIKIFFEPTIPLEHQKILLDFAEEISAEVDSLNIYKVNKRENANYHIYYLNKENDVDYDLRIGNKKEGYYVSWNGKQQLYEANLKLDTRLFSDEEKIIEQLKVNFFLSLGFFYPSQSIPAPGLLSLNSSEKRITEMDMKILKYHYSFGICKGTKLDKFEETHQSYRKLIQENPNSKLTIIHPYEYFN